MRPAGRPGTRRWLLLPAAVLILSGLMAAGCSSSKPAYCTDAANLKTSVQNLGNVDVAQERPQLPADRADQRQDQRSSRSPPTRNPRTRRRPRR